MDVSADLRGSAFVVRVRLAYGIVASLISRSSQYRQVAARGRSKSTGLLPCELSWPARPGQTTRPGVGPARTVALSAAGRNRPTAARGRCAELPSALEQSLSRAAEGNGPSDFVIVDDQTDGVDGPHGALTRDLLRIPVDPGSDSGVTRALVPVDPGAVGAKRRAQSGVGAERRVEAHAVG